MKNMKFLVLALAMVCGVNAEVVTGTILSTTGHVEILTPGAAKPVPAVTGTLVPQGSKILADDGTALVSPMPGTAVQVDNGTHASFDKLEYSKSGFETSSRKAIITMDKGSIFATLQKLDPKKSDFRIVTPRGVAAARGTTIHATWNPATNSGTFVCTEGTATFTFQVNGVNVTRTITAGQAIDFGGTGGGNVTVGESRPATSTEQNSGQVFQITAVNTVVDLQQRGLVQGSTRSEFTIGSGTIRVNTGNPTSLTQNSPQ